MFEGFLRSRFLTKCKSALKRVIVRIEGVKRKRNAVQKYLKNDIADLLKNGFHLNAYGRAEGLLIEINTIPCYDFVEQFCKVILEHLPVMNKQKECPEECKETVPSLMFAAARFADLPELRELRSVFIDKYGKSLESHINLEFVKKLKANHPTKDAKVQLLLDVASEFEIEWDPKALEQQLYKPPAPAEQVSSQNNDDGEVKIKESRNRPVQERAKQSFDSDDGPTTNEENQVPPGRKEAGDDDDKYKSHGSEIRPAIERTNENPNKEKGDERKPARYSLIPPPYTKQKAVVSKTSSGNTSRNHSQDDSVGEAKPKPKSVRRRKPNPPPDIGDTRIDGDGKGKSAGIGIKNEDPSLEVVPEDEKKIGKREYFHSRGVSLPPGEIGLIAKEKGHTRTFSSPLNEHAHPKLLDYDDFLARLAALRQN